MDVIDLTGSSPPRTSSQDRRLEYVAPSSDDETENRARAPNSSKGKRKATGDSAESRGKRRVDHKAARNGVLSESRATERSIQVDSYDSPHKPRHKKSKKPQSSTAENSRRASPEPKADSTRETRPDSPPLFFMDVRPSGGKKHQYVPPAPPSAPPVGSPPKPSAEPPKSTETNGLLLPVHVMLADESKPGNDAGGDNEDNASVLSSDDSQIAFVNEAEFPRYYHVGTSKAVSGPKCNTCGEAGHFSRDCDRVICLNCGVKDEHGTRSCPFSLICYNCGGRGHISRECPEARKGGRRCDRCGSFTHAESNCSTNWRIYDYNSTRAREDELKARVQRVGQAFQQGGEGYVAWEPGCYNCGGSGHWGDECTISNRGWDRPDQSSAFSEYNVYSGPFANIAIPPAGEKLKAVARSLLDAERRDSRFDDGHGFRVEGHVGRKGREAEKKRAAQRYHEVEDNAEDDAADWFSGRGQLSIVGAASRSNGSGRDSRNANGSGSGSRGGRSIKITTSTFVASHSSLPAKPPARTPTKQPSLLARMGSPPPLFSRDPPKKSRSDRHRDDDRKRPRERDDYRERDYDSHRDRRERDRERDRGHERRGEGSRNGPRYHGGYG